MYKTLKLVKKKKKKKKETTQEKLGTKQEQQIQREVNLSSQ